MYYVPYRYEVDVAVQYYHDGAADERSSSLQWSTVQVLVRGRGQKFHLPIHELLSRQTILVTHFTSFVAPRTRKKKERRAFVSMMASGSGRVMRLPIGLMVFALLLPNAFAALSMEVRDRLDLF